MAISSHKMTFDVNLTHESSHINTHTSNPIHSRHGQKIAIESVSISLHAVFVVCCCCVYDIYPLCVLLLPFLRLSFTPSRSFALYPFPLSCTNSLSLSSFLISIYFSPCRSILLSLFLLCSVFSLLVFRW